MNPTEQRIFDIIRADVCGMCPGSTANQNLKILKNKCEYYRPSCYAGYQRQAEAIYEQVVKPLMLSLEDDLK